MDIETLFMQFKEYDVKKTRNFIEELIKKNVK